MSFKIFTDTSSNLPTPLLNENQIGVIPLEYIIDGKAHTCLDTEAFDGERYFDAIRSGTVVHLRIETAQEAVQLLVQVLKLHTHILQRGHALLIITPRSGAFHEASGR